MKKLSRILLLVVIAFASIGCGSGNNSDWEKNAQAASGRGEHGEK